VGDDAGKTVYDRASHLLNHPEQVRLKLLPRAEQFQVYDHVLVVVCARIIAGNYLCPLLPSRRHGICNPANIQDIRQDCCPKLHILYVLSLLRPSTNAELQLSNAHLWLVLHTTVILSCMTALTSSS